MATWTSIRVLGQKYNELAPRSYRAGPRDNARKYNKALSKLQRKNMRSYSVSRTFFPINFVRAIATSTESSYGYCSRGLIRQITMHTRESKVRIERGFYSCV